jgi:hypothetical protein
MSLHIGGQSSAISMNSHGLVGRQCLRDKIWVAEQINCGLVVKEDHVAEIHWN